MGEAHNNRKRRDGTGDGSWVIEAVRCWARGEVTSSTAGMGCDAHAMDGAEQPFRNVRLAKSGAAGKPEQASRNRPRQSQRRLAF